MPNSIWQSRLLRAKQPRQLSIDKERAKEFERNPTRYKVCKFPAYHGSPIGTNSFTLARVISVLRCFTNPLHVVEIVDERAKELGNRLVNMANQEITNIEHCMNRQLTPTPMAYPDEWDYCADEAEKWEEYGFVAPAGATRRSVRKLRRFARILREWPVVRGVW